MERATSLGVHHTVLRVGSPKYKDGAPSAQEVERNGQRLKNFVMEHCLEEKRFVARGALPNLGNGIYGYIASNEAADAYVEKQMLQSMMHIAKDVKIQGEFNPAQVYAYRLLGYENRAIADEDFRNDVIDAGEIGSGHRVTALYEIVFQEGDLPEREAAPPLDDGAAFAGTSEIDMNDIVLLKVRYKEPGASEEDAASEVSSSLMTNEVQGGFDGAGGDLQYAAAVAAYAEILKGSPYASPDALAAIRIILEEQAGRDAERAEFLELFDTANGL